MADEEINLTMQAIFELQKDAARAKERSSTMGACGWQRRISSTNRAYLHNTIIGNMQSNKRIDKKLKGKMLTSKKTSDNTVEASKPCLKSRCSDNSDSNENDELSKPHVKSEPTRRMKSTSSDERVENSRLNNKRIRCHPNRNEEITYPHLNVEKAKRNHSDSEADLPHPNSENSKRINNLDSEEVLPDSHKKNHFDCAKESPNPCLDSQKAVNCSEDDRKLSNLNYKKARITKPCRLFNIALKGIKCQPDKLVSHRNDKDSNSKLQSKNPLKGIKCQPDKLVSHKNDQDSNSKLQSKKEKFSEVYINKRNSNDNRRKFHGEKDDDSS